MLDFVPNHTALDHPWTKTHPDFYVQGSEQALAAQPENYCRIETGQGPRILAHGRDPNFPGWPDTLQLDYANPALQAAQMAELATIAGQCDGVRCDMAMLPLPEVFQRTWGCTPSPFWPKAIAAVRDAHRGFTFLAEAYWDLEWELQQQGFDYCYDKRLYDRLRHGRCRRHSRPSGGRARLPGSAGALSRESRRAARRGGLSLAAASGGRHRHVFRAGPEVLPSRPVRGRAGRRAGAFAPGPARSPQPDIVAFYDRLLVPRSARRLSQWRLVVDPAATGLGRQSDMAGLHCLCLAHGERQRYVVVVNYSDHQAQCRLRLPFAGLTGRQFRLVDMMGSEVYWRDGDGLIEPGLYIDLGAWRCNVFRLDLVGP